MKNIITATFCFLILMGCSSDDNNLLEDIAIRGGFIQFSDVPTLEFDVLNADSAVVSEVLIDPNENATSYSLDLIYNDVVVSDFLTLNSFPANLEIQVGDALSAVGLSSSDVTSDTVLTFVATIVTTTGTYSGLSPDFDENNVNQGGDSTVRLKSDGLRDAIEFDITFF